MPSFQPISKWLQRVERENKEIKCPAFSRTPDNSADLGYLSMARGNASRKIESGKLIDINVHLYPFMRA
jgi:hypothetical protein